MKININMVKPGNKLLSPIFINNTLLYNTDEILTAEIIEKLKKFNIRDVDIIINENDDLMNKLISIELNQEAVQNLRDLNINNTISIAKEIVFQITNNKEIVNYLSKIKHYSKITYDHSVNVAVIATIIGMGYKMNGNELSELAVAAILHDIGKKAISKDILDKPSKLTNEETKEIRKHTIYGYNMVASNIYISNNSKIAILQHHENEDGSEYPYNLKGTDTILPSKIIHLADIFEAMTAERPYKESHPNFECIEYLMAQGGSTINSEVLNIFLKYCPAYPIGEKVTLSTGEEATVIKNYSETNLRPKVRTDSGKVLCLKNTINNSITIIK